MSKTPEPAVGDTELGPDGWIGEKEGTLRDIEDMRRMGKLQLFRRNFNFFSIFGFTMILMSTWESQLGTAVFGLENGGTAGSIYVYIGVVVGMAFVIISMAEMASMAPTAGGQYHWVSEFAPPSAQRFISYLIGWLCVLGWQAGTASSCFLAGTEIQGLLVLNHPDAYVRKRWHGVLLTIAICFLCLVFNTVLAKRLPLVEGAVLILHVLGFFGIMIPLWVLAPRPSAHAVFTEFFDGGGWGNVGLSCLVGMLSPVVSLIGSDAATHMSEELKNASKTLPRAMILTAIFNGVLGFVMLVTFCFCVGDVAQAVTTPTGYPFIWVFWNATGSSAAATGMTAIMIILSTFCAITNMATASRQLFAFSRDQGFPFHRFFSTVRSGWDVPLNAILFTFTITCLLSLINIGSMIAFNQITSLGLCALLTSYMVSISCMTLKRIRSEPLLPSPFKLGAFGLPVNAISLAFLALAYVFIFFPPMRKPSNEVMNWAVVIYAGVMTISLTYFFAIGRRNYVGPVEYVRKNL